MARDAQVVRGLAAAGEQMQQHQQTPQPTNPASTANANANANAIQPGPVSPQDQVTATAGLAMGRVAAQQQLAAVQTQLGNARNEARTTTGVRQAAANAEVNALEHQERHLKTTIEGINAAQGAL